LVGIGIGIKHFYGNDKRYIKKQAIYTKLQEEGKPNIPDIAPEETMVKRIIVAIGVAIAAGLTCYLIVLLLFMGACFIML